MTDGAPAAATTSRAPSCPAAQSRRRARPAADRAGDAAARRHGAQPAELPLAAPPGSRSPSTAARGSASRAFEDGIARAAAAPPAACWFRSSSTAAPTRSRSSSRPAIRSTGTAPEAGARRRRRDRLHRGRAPALAPVAAPRWRRSTREGKVTVLPAIGYTNPDQSHFTSRHYWEVGATDAAACAPAGSAATSTPSARRTTRSRGSPSTRAAAVARDREGPGRGDRRPGPVHSGRAESRARSRSGCSTRSARSATRTEEQDTALSDRRPRRRAVVRLRSSSCRSAGDNQISARPRTRPRTTSSRAAGRACRDARAGLPLRCVSLEAPGDYDTHADQPDELATR